jgi:hypothetical protein
MTCEAAVEPGELSRGWWPRSEREWLRWRPGSGSRSSRRERVRVQLIPLRVSDILSRYKREELIACESMRLFAPSVEISLLKKNKNIINDASITVPEKVSTMYGSVLRYTT